MGYIIEPDNIDYSVKSKKWTTEQENELSMLIAEEKIIYNSPVKKLVVKPKNQEDFNLLKQLFEKMQLDWTILNTPNI